MKAWINLRDEAPSLLVFLLLLLEGPPVAAVSLAASDDFDSKVDDTNDVSDAPNEIGRTLCNLSTGCPTAPS